MNKEYYAEKRVYEKQNIEFIQVHFDNGDFIVLGKKEVVDISIKLYDKLILENDDICPVAESGQIKLKLSQKPSCIYSEVFVYNKKKYNADRKSYIENRFCTEGGIKYIRIFDENNWYESVYGNMSAQMENGFLCINFSRKKTIEPCDGAHHTILLNDVVKSLVDNINIDFENCESFSVYKNEIIDMQINLKRQLAWGSHDYLREIDNGYIILKLNEENNWHRKVYLACDTIKKNASIKKLENRLCGKKQMSTHDICHLYVNYEHAGFGVTREEILENNDIRSDEEIERLEKLEEETDSYCLDFIGGYCQRQLDGTIIITFGNSANNVKQQTS